MAEAHKGAAKRPRREQRIVDGIVLLDKPTGLTSNSALQRVKRLFRARKAGHTGSLDPLASGMLPICLGQATKVSAYLLAANKTYRATARFGIQTDTADADGSIVAESDRRAIAREELEAACSRFIGDIRQVPPMYSALKHKGRRLYELAREGVEVERPERQVRIYSLALELYDPEAPTFLVTCSKGTYIRTLIEDIAAAAGTLGHVTALHRLCVEPFEPDQLVSLETLEAAAEGGMEALDRHLGPIESALPDWREIVLNRDQAYYLRQGNPVQAAQTGEPGEVRIVDDQQRFLGIGEVLADGRVAPRRLFVSQAE